MKLRSIIYRYRTLLMAGLLMLVFSAQSQATHLMGGELTYRHDGSDAFGALYNVNLIVYRYCDTTGGGTAQLDQTMMLGIYVNSPSGIPGQLDWYYTETLTLNSSSFVTAIEGNSNCPFQSTACIERGEYSLTIYLPHNINGYHLIVERCCRNGNVINIDNPGGAGMTFYAFIPPGIINSTPQITDVSVPYVCSGDTVTIVNNAFDPDGDSLVYAFVTPYNGYSSSMDPMPDPQFNSPYQLPVPDVTYAVGYGSAQILGAGGYTSIDAASGLTRYYFPAQGFYVAAIEIREYRNGVLISSTRRDLQFISIVCAPNAIPVYSGTAVNSVHHVIEGQSICFNAGFTDADGDSLFLTASGPLLDSNLVAPPGAINNSSGAGSVSSQFCWTPPCGMARPTPYQFTVTVTDNGCPQKITNQVFSVYVDPVSASLVPTVSISQFPAGIICQGSVVTFLASGTLQGNNPQFQWYLNGVPAQTGDSLFTPASVSDGDIITVSMISSAQCLFNDSAMSAPYVVNITPQPAPQVSITSNPSANLCPQQICLFTASTANAGNAPSYQWYINGNAAGTNQPAFTAANPAGTMAVYVVVTPSTGCPPETSDTINFNIQPYLSPDIQVTASAGDSICPGQPVFLTVTSSQTGYAPVYNWYLNGVSLGIGTDTLTLPAPGNGAVVTASVTSGYPCLSPAFTYSEPLEFHHYPPLTGDLTDGPLEICMGLPVDLFMLAGGGKTGTYQYSWSPSPSATSQNTVIPFSSGYYYATVDDACYDPVTDSVYLEVLPVPDADFIWSPDNPSVFFPKVQFVDRSIDAMTWDWQFGDGGSSVQQNPLHEYVAFGRMPVSLKVTNNYGCIDTMVRFIDVEGVVTTWFPNSFTPNGDGINDLFGPVSNLAGSHSLTIYNRWGQVIFSNDESGYWDGKGPDGTESPQGVYVFRARFQNPSGSAPVTGFFNLIR